MVLVGYSDSEGSDNDEQPDVKVTNDKPAKAAFHKVVDKSKPNKIQVNLAGADGTVDDRDTDGPIKRVRTNGGFGGFNSFLPAPKNAGAAAVAKPTSTGHDSSAEGVGVRRTVNLKTGAAPAFIREQVAVGDNGGSGDTTSEADKRHRDKADEVKLVGKPTAFKPLSVARKPKKKNLAASASLSATKAKTAAERQAEDSQPSATPDSALQPKKKLSLFSAAVEEESPAGPTLTALEEGNPASFDDEPGGEAYYPVQQPQTQRELQQARPSPPRNDLASLASSLNLSAAERRQLFGRNGPTNAQVAEFNLAAEYQSNRQLAESGESAPAHNPVRSIASGKHSLQQLINNATSQRDALEESFARGKGSKKEAGSRYGW